MKKRLLIAILAVISVFCIGLCFSACGEAGTDSGNNNGNGGGEVNNGHTHSYADSVVAPTCTEQGYTLHTCSCGDSYKDNYVNAKGHTEVIDAGVAATCTSTGISEGKHCSVCNEELVAQQTIEKLPHTEAIDKGIRATCTSTGLSEGKHCSVCNEVLVAQQTIEKLPHTEVIDKGKRETCTEEGLTEGKHCSDCKATLVEQRVIRPYGHTEVIDWAVEATCASTGLTEGKHCSVCNEVLVAQQVVGMLPHKEEILWGYEPTCSSAGLTDGKYCSVCYTELVAQQVVDPLPHTEVIIEGTPATCTTTGISDGKYCSVCYTEIAAQEFIDLLPHTEVIDEGVEATCLSTGLTEGSHCSVCEAVIVEQEIIKKLPHDYVNNFCTQCSSSRFTDGLVYELNEDGNSYYVKSIGTATETDIVIADIYNGKSVTAIGYLAFYMSHIISITIPDSVTHIDDLAFDGCSALEEITGPAIALNYVYRNNLKAVVITSGQSIEELAFAWSVNLTSISLPASLSYIGDKAFYFCKNLESITVSPENTKFSSAGNCLIDLEDKTLIVGCNDSVIPGEGSVTSIGDGAFYERTALTDIVIPDGVTSIGDEAFSNCTALVNLTLPDSLTNIGAWAFNYCSITRLTIPDSVTSIGSGAFSGCDKIESVSMPTIAIREVTQANLKTVVITSGDFIDGYAFGSCYKLTNITIADSVKTVISYAFGSCETIEIATIPTSAIEALPKKNLVTLVITSGDSIENNAFNGSGKLSSLTIGNVTSIGSNAFMSCPSLKSVTIGENVKEIGRSAFYKLTSVYYEGDIAGWCGISGLECLLSEDCSLYIGGEEISGELVIPGNVTSIGDYAFQYCNKITGLTISKGVTSIGANAFFYCHGLTEISIPDSVTSIGYYAFGWCSGLVSITIPDSVTTISSSFNSCDNLESATIPAVACSAVKNTNLKTVVITSGQTIEPSAFYNARNLVSVTLPDSLTSIGKYAFYDCISLLSITIPAGVTTMAEWVFTDSQGIVIYAEAESQPAGWKETWIICGHYIVWNCKFNDRDKDGYAYIVEDGIRYRVKDGLAEVALQSKALKGEVELRSTVSYKGDDYPVTKIGYEAFFGCSNITGFSIPDSITTITSLAFYGSGYYDNEDNWTDSVLYIGRHLIAAKKDVASKYSVKYNTLVIADDAFKGCTNLTDIIIGDSVIAVSRSAFSDCTNIERAFIPAVAIPAIPKTKLRVVEITSGERIEDEAFKNCTSLESVGTNNKLTYIGKNAFDGCTNLTVVYVPEEIIFIGNDAFRNCPALNYNETDDGYYLGNSVCHYIVFIGVKNKQQTSYKIEETTRIIYSRAFYLCSRLSSIELPQKLASISDGAFGYCDLKTLTVYDSLTYIGKEAFQCCFNFASIIFKGSTDQWSAIEKGENWKPPKDDFAVGCNNGYFEKDDC